MLVSVPGNSVRKSNNLSYEDSYLPSQPLVGLLPVVHAREGRKYLWATSGSSLDFQDLPEEDTCKAAPTLPSLLSGEDTSTL